MVSAIEHCSRRLFEVEGMRVSKIWEILDHFKRFCRLRGWKTSVNEDWVELNHDYHNFLWTRNVAHASFKAIISNMKCVVQKGLSYSVVEPSHLAWLFSEVPQQDIIRTVLDSPEFSRRIAIYDLSHLLEGKNLCTKLNNTDSLVFHEFETFLKSELKVRVESLRTFTDSKVKISSDVLPELA
jgi:hypothetical protein